MTTTALNDIVKRDPRRRGARVIRALIDQVMLANGIRPPRVTDRQFVGEPFAIVARVAQSLRA